MRGLNHPLRLNNESDAVMEQGAMETNFGTLSGIETGTLCTRVKVLNYFATLHMQCIMHSQTFISRNIFIT